MKIIEISTDRGYDACASAGPDCAWYALRTRSNYEKIAASFMEARGFEHFLPLYKAPKRWSDRVVENIIPLFPGYLFCRFDARYRTPILGALGVVSIVAFGGRPAKIDDREIEAIRKALGSGQNVEPHPHLQEGCSIRVERGPLAGLEGILIKKRTWRIVISVQLLRRAVSVEVDPGCVVPIENSDVAMTPPLTTRQMNGKEAGAVARLECAG